MINEKDVQNDEERYFFTQATTTSTTTPGTTTTVDLGTSCWKCDQMTYADCSAKGDLEKCEKVFYYFFNLYSKIPAFKLPLLDKLKFKNRKNRP